MADAAQGSAAAAQEPSDKGKGKSTEPAAHDVSMETEDSSSEDELDEVCHAMQDRMRQYSELTFYTGCPSW